MREAVKGKVEESNKRFVSTGAYACRKMLAKGMSAGVIICIAVLLLLAINVPYSFRMEAREEAACVARGNTWDPMISVAGMSEAIFVILAPPLVIVLLSLWYGSRRSWKTVRTMQPINFANTADLPAPDTLVRASQEPEQAQEAVLLRASVEKQEQHEEQLLRASGEQN